MWVMTIHIAHKDSEEARSALRTAAYINQNKHLKVFPLYKTQTLFLRSLDII